MKILGKSIRSEPVKANEIDDLGLSALVAGEDITREKALEIPALAGCVDYIAKTVSNIPIKLYKKENGEIKEVEDKRVTLLNEETGDMLDATQMKNAMVRDYFLGKGGYCYIHKNGIEVESLHYVDCDKVTVTTGVDPIFKTAAIQVNGKAYFPHEFIRFLRNTKDGVEGESVVKQNTKLMSVMYNSLKYEENLVLTGGNKKGFVKSARKLSQEAIDALKNAWRKLYRNSSENVVILNDGLDFKESSNTSVEMQLNENKRTNGDEVCKIFNLPPSLTTGNLSEQDEKSLIKYCLNNVLGEFVTALNTALLLESEKGSYFFAPDMYELTKGDIEKRYNAYQSSISSGWMQIDEVRKKENMAPLGLDFVKLGLQDVLYNTKTQTVYTPNTDKTASIKKGKAGEENEGRNQE